MSSQEEDGTTLLGSAGAEDDESMAGLMLVFLSACCVSVVSLLVKICSRSMSAIQVTWLGSCGRLAALWCVSRPRAVRASWRWVSLRCIAGWLGLLCFAAAVSVLDLGSATAVARATSARNPLVVASTVVGLGLICRPSRTPWWASALALAAGAASAVVKRAVRALPDDFWTAAHLNAVFGLVASPLALLLSPEPVLKLRGRPQIAPLPLGLCLLAGAVDVASQLCFAAALKRAPPNVAPAAARVLDVTASFAWHRLFFDSRALDNNGVFYSAEPDGLAGLGAALVVGPPLLLALRAQKTRRRPRPAKSTEVVNQLGY